MSRVSGSEPLAGDAEGLTGITANDATYPSAPGSSIEGVKIRPDRRRMKGTVFNTRNQVFGCADFVFHVADRLSARESECNRSSELSSPGADVEERFGR